MDAVLCKRAGYRIDSVVIINSFVEVTVCSWLG